MSYSKTAKTPRIVIIGAGPCGIGAGWNLLRRKYHDWAVYEMNAWPGGLSASFQDERGFTWDIGGHVFFSRFKEFDLFLKQVIGGGLNCFKRDAWVYVNKTWIPYPLQNNIHFLGSRDYSACVRSLPASLISPSKNMNFHEYLVAGFGSYLANKYLVPMNRKMWSYPLKRLSSQWVKDRISPLRALSVSGSSGREIKNKDWGPNRIFTYPEKGGCGEIFQRGADSFHGRLKLGYKAEKIDLATKTVHFSNGKNATYDHLIYTGHIASLARMLTPGDKALKKCAQNLKSNRLLVIGLGIKRPNYDRRSWLYFPEKKYPFFRVTHLSNYSDHNVPDGNNCLYSSLLLEISLPMNNKPDQQRLVTESIRGLIHAGLLEGGDKNRIVSRFVYECPYAYPLPTLNRDRDLRAINGFLLKHRIRVKGRFGAFLYENGNMDDCFMQGFLTVEDILRL